MSVLESAKRKAARLVTLRRDTLHADFEVMWLGLDDKHKSDYLRTDSAGRFVSDTPNTKTAMETAKVIFSRERGEEHLLENMEELDSQH